MIKAEGEDTLQNEQEGAPERAGRGLVFTPAPFSHEGTARAGELLLESLGLPPGALDKIARDTPVRFARAWEELTSGYRVDPQEVLRTTAGELGFQEQVDQLIVVGGIEFASTCEHHLLPFLGSVDVGYLPRQGNPLIVGASKLPRLVEVFARRLQVQERMGQEIANTLNGALKPRGVGVRVKATHLCMACRGVRKVAPMVTEVLLGKFRLPEVRSEFWTLADHARR